MDRLLLWLATALLLVTIVSPTPASGVGVTGALAVAALVAVLVSAAVRYGSSSTLTVSPGVPARDERCRRGAFRRQTHPRTPGRPLPRAPQLATS